MAKHRKFSSNPEDNAMVRRLLREGWSANLCGKHVKLRSPTGIMVMMAKTPSDWRAHLNTAARIRRAQRLMGQRKSEVK